MEKRCQWRALPAERDVVAAKIPDNRQAQRIGKNGAGPCLMGAPTGRVMRQGLAVKSDYLCIRNKIRQNGDMGGFDNFRGLGHARVTGPAPQYPPNPIPFGFRIRAIGIATECDNGFSVGFQQSRIDTIQ
jgi:hypothetical protein